LVSAGRSTSNSSTSPAALRRDDRAAFAVVLETRLQVRQASDIRDTSPLLAVRFLLRRPSSRLTGLSLTAKKTRSLSVVSTPHTWRGKCTANRHSAVSRIV